MMLLYQKELGLGEVSSNLHHLLLDMIQHLDPENPDLRSFLKEKSLTTYFDNAFIKDRGITNLRQTLRAQADDSLTATVSFVSELRGVKYLMDLLEKDSLAEVVVVNATAEEFKNWLLADNLNDVDGRGGVRCGAILKTDHQSERSIVPGLVYLSDLAFTDPADKIAFLGNLAQFNAQNDRHGLILPPLCISTRPFGSGPDLEKEGAAYAEAAFGAAAPVVVVGPSPRLTQDKDPFRAYLPAGYLFAAHFLSKPSQKIAIRNVNVSSNGRFRVIGAGNVEMRDSLEGVICGESAADKYAFAVDFYLYIVLTIVAAVSSKAGAVPGRVDPDALYNHFHEDFGATLHKESGILNDALLLPATSFSMYSTLDSDGREPGKSDPKTSAVKNPVTQGTNLTGVVFKQKTREGRTLQLDITDIQWFNLARSAAGFEKK
jgi:hypothetical protein